jgi:citrate lyase subunit beta/citryl-CoA lyase
MSVPRSYLFVPGDRPERFAKAAASGAGCIVLDLEDAVAPGAKDAAREAVLAMPACPVPALLRINPAATEWHAADVAAARTLLRRGAIAGIMLPKADAQTAQAAVAQGCGPLVVLLETVAALIGLRALAAVPGIARIAFGAVDFALDAGIPGEGEALAFVRSQLVLESRYADLPPPVDGVSTALDDATTLAADVRRARDFGFGAKLCIHPRQIAAVETGFAPSAEELAWAQRVRTAAATGGAVAVDGKLVDAPILARANALLAAAGLG